jgi:hypothetical protein
MRCPECGEKLPWFKKHACKERILTTCSPSSPIATGSKGDDSGDFTTSMAIGYATNNPLIGGLVGGSLVGGMVGASLNPSDAHANAIPNKDETSPFSSRGGETGGTGTSVNYDPDPTPSYDSGNSADPDIGGDDF